MAFIGHWGYEPGVTETTPKPVTDGNGNAPVNSTAFSRTGTTSKKFYIDKAWLNDNQRGYRSELTFGTCPFDWNRGALTESMWFGFSVRIPGPYPVSPESVYHYDIFFQVHSSPIGGFPPSQPFPTLSPMLEMNVNPTGNNAGTFGITLRGTNIPYADQLPLNGGDVQTYKTNNFYTYATDEWIDVVVQFKCTNSTDGMCKVWVNDELKVNQSGILTGYLGHGKPYPKFGIYTFWRPTNTNASISPTTRTRYIDDFRVASGDSTDNYALVSPGTTQPPPSITPPSAPTNLRVA